jgi:hypothetical protein
MVVYYKFVSTDFAGIPPNLAKLQDEINAANIDPVCTHINAYDDTVEIHFDLSLSGAEEAILADLCTNHDPTPIPTYSSNVSAILIANKTQNQTFTRVGTLIFPGGSELRAKAISNVDVGPTGYTLRLMTLLGTVVCEATFDNTAPAVVDLGVPNVVPSGLTSMQVLLRKNGGVTGQFAYLDALYVYYN